MTKLPDTDHILLNLSDGWLTISLNTPHNRNALSDELVAELLAVIDAIEHERSVRGVTLRGEGGVFCAGGDLKAFRAAMQEGGARHADIAAMNSEAGVLFARIANLPQVVIVLVEGAAIAGGLGLVCCADIVIVEENAKFSLTETQLGIPPAQIAPYIVGRLGLTTARNLMLTGARFRGREAKALGLANETVSSPADLLGAEAALRRQILRCAPGANAATKAILLASQSMTGADLRNFAAAKFADCLLSDEGREGVLSFLHKRSPGWAPQDEDASSDNAGQS